MEHHFHWGIEHIFVFGTAMIVFRYIWKLVAAYLAGNDGPIGQLGLALGGLAQ